MRSAVTQYEHVGTLPGIFERFMVPLLEALLAMFPFHVLGFHAEQPERWCANDCWNAAPADVEALRP